MKLGGYKNHTRRHLLIISALILLFLLFLNLIIAYLIHSIVLKAECMTMQQMKADNRCLYIAAGQIYEQGTRVSPHYGQPCGSDITSVLPVSHINNPIKYLLPNYISNICISKVLKPKPTAIPVYAIQRTQITSTSGTLRAPQAADITAYNTLVRCYSLRVGSTSSACPNPNLADLNKDGIVDSIDYNIVLYNLYYGRQNISTQSSSQK